jgi:DNA helicase-2/ATP-dependent DNA helicase PcrA
MKQLNETLLKKFSEILTNLNPQQLEAVERIDGPVLVLAGPGTGKTQILAARTANILLKTDSNPENILCLTYTDSGTVAMRKRLVSFIGPDAYRIPIHTFHSFCNMVIQENLEKFGYNNLDPIDELEQEELLRKIVDELPANHALKRYTGDEYYETSRLKKLFEIIKKEAWEAQFLLDKIEEYVTSLPEREEYIYKKAVAKKDGTSFKKGDLNTDKLNEDIKKMEQLKSAVLLFENYQKLLASNKRYDFADMILWVIKAFKENPSLLANYQEKYLYFLVDEFQDTSGSQNELLSLLVHFWEDPNVFVVGDDDQSIYRFQGANVENVLHFQKEYQNLHTISLKENYRSTQQILDVSAALITHNKTRLRKEAGLMAKGPHAQLNSYKPVIWNCYNSIHEAAAVTEQIIALKQAGVSMNEVAVLYRNHNQSELIVKYLQANNIGINLKKRENVLLHPLVKKIIQLMQYLQAENKKPHSGEEFLFEILHYEEFQIPLLELAALSTEIAKKNFSERTTSWRQELKILADKQQQSLFNEPSKIKSIRNFCDLIEALIQAVANSTLQELIEKIINHTGILAKIIGSPDQSWQMEVLNTFFDFIKLHCNKKPSHTLGSMLQLIQLMNERKIQLPAERLYCNEDGVNFLTAHGAKGLEYDHVFIIGAERKKWDEAGNTGTYTMPGNLFDQTENNEEEARRLFYVALTRARKQLVVSYAANDLKEKEQEPSKFVAELRDSGLMEEVNQQFEKQKIDAFLQTTMQSLAIQLPESLLDSPFIDSLLEKYSLSVTHLNAYLHCPVSFYFNNFIRVPSAKSPNMTFGSAVHHALEVMFKKMNDTPDKQFHDVGQFIKDFKWYMRKHEDSFLPATFERKIEYGEQILSNYYAKYINYWNKITSVEKNYKNVVVGGVPINGKLDKLEFDGNFVKVVDYKTGNYKNAVKKFKRPDAQKVQDAIAKGKEPNFEEVHGGDYWRQAVFYKLIMDHDTTRNWEMRSAEFDFVEPDKDTGNFHKEPVPITPQDLAFVQQQIVSVYAKIKNKEFTQGCGKEDCSWCQFTNNWLSGNKQISTVQSNQNDFD